MTAPLRSKRGCWTCRLRKKKCDEGRPHCTTCESLSITCYGYGAKPDWMDNGEKERAISISIKEIVKHTSRRKATAQAAKHGVPVTRIAPKPVISVNEDVPTNFESSSQHVTPSSYVESLRTAYVAQQSENLTPLSYTGNSDIESNESLFSIPADESVFLMNFLDHVFPLQYPMYKPLTRSGGRGWLLAALLRTKPLYHAALALSVYHHRIATHGATTNISDHADLAIRQERHMEACLEILNQETLQGCPKRPRDMMSTMLQLLFFEIFTNESTSWGTHLRAATSMFQRSYEDSDGSHFASKEESKKIIRENLPLRNNDLIAGDSVVADEVTHYRFLTSTLIWLDIISSITRGKGPELFFHHARIISSNSEIRLEYIMGCKNWVMLQISRITNLHSRILQAHQELTFDCAGFIETAGDIDKEIQSGVTQEAFTCFNISDHDYSQSQNAISEPTQVITYIFACMASIYLHLVTQGFHNLDVVDHSVTAAMTMLQTQGPAQILPALVSPLFVIGCVAREEHKSFFRLTFSSWPLLDPILKYRGRISNILEDIWSRRISDPLFDWKACVELTGDILLL